MTGHDDFDRTIAAWFEDDARSPLAAASLEEVLEVTRRRSPRRAWLTRPGSHWVGTAPSALPGLAARSAPRRVLGWPTVLVLIMVISALIGGALVVGARLRPSPPLPVLPSPAAVQPSPAAIQPSPAAIQPSPSATPRAASPTGHLGRLAYALDGSIYVADWDGRNPVRIAKGVFDPGGAGPGGCGSYWASGSMWSPDGRYLAFRSAWDSPCPGVERGNHAFISDETGKIVASFPGQGWRISWSPDSTRVASWVDVYKTFGIYGLDGVQQALFTAPTGYAFSGDSDPRWSSDGTSLLRSAGAITPSGQSGLWAFPTDGGTPWRVPDTDPRVHSPTYSRDGTRLAYVEGPFPGSLVIAEADGTSLRTLAGIEDVSPSGSRYGIFQDAVVSPSGDRVAFIWSQADPWASSPGPQQPPEELRVVDVASGAVTTLFTAGPGQHLGITAFSPEGDRILFTTSDADYSATSLRGIQSDGSGQRLLVAGTGVGSWQSLP
jgi:Tol biopolymer transport system component